MPSDAVNLADMHRLREETGCGVIEATRALRAADGDYARAQEYLRARRLSQREADTLVAGWAGVERPPDSLYAELDAVAASGRGELPVEIRWLVDRAADDGGYPSYRDEAIESARLFAAAIIDHWDSLPRLLVEYALRAYAYFDWQATSVERTLDERLPASARWFHADMRARLEVIRAELLRREDAARAEEDRPGPDPA